MQQRILHGLMFILLAGAPTAFAAEESISSDDYWKPYAQEKNVAIYSRPRPGSQLKEFKAVGPIDAPTGAVCAVIDDFQNYPKIMRDTTRMPADQTGWRLDRWISEAFAKSSCGPRLHIARLEEIMVLD